jgi:hypothetical protein
MKKFLLLSFAITFGFCAMAQKVSHIPNDLKNLSVKRLINYSVDETLNLSNDFNPYVNAQQNKAVNEVQIGYTNYDLQTNQSVQNRIYYYPDGTIGGTFTYGTAPIPTSTDRGTGYDYFDGTVWGAIPTARIESVRNGWPSYSPLLGGELVISHNGTTGLLVTTRPAKGTGTWTTSVLVGPQSAGPGATTGLTWPRSITVGNTIHVIACTAQTTSTSATVANMWSYEGLVLALVYYRSDDGGLTWSTPQILPGMDSTSYVTGMNNIGFGGDSYSWAAPKGDTIAFVVGDSWGGLFAMKSFDGGDNWTKIHIYDFPMDGLTAPTPIIASFDGSAAIALDNAGKVHVLCGKMRVSDDDLSDDPPASSYYPYTDGLIYWNENMPVIDSGLLNNDSLLALAGNYIAGMIDYDNDSIITFPTVGTGEWPFGNYYLSLTSMPQIIIDDAGDMYITYSSCREDKINPSANPNSQIYRHLYAMRSADNGLTWGDPIDLTNNVLHDYDECVFGSLSYTSNDHLHIVYQADAEPGLGVRGDLDPYTDNYIYYLTFPKSDLIGVKEINNGNSSAINIFPNPAQDVANIDITLSNNQNVKLDIFNMVGQNVYNKDFGTLGSGTHNLNVNTSNFNSGIYFFSIQAGDNKITRKVIVE